MNGKRRAWTLGLVVAGLLAVVLALLLLAPQMVRAANRDVCPSAPCYTTIQAAIDAANPGDIIRVQEGPYPESVEISKSLTLLGGWNSDFTGRTPGTSIISGAATPLAGGEAGPQSTVPPVVMIGEYEVNHIVPVAGIMANYVGSGLEVVVDGFEITGGAAQYGAGLYVDVDTDARVVINDNFIHDNDATYSGGGIWAEVDNRSSLEITNNDIMTNTAMDGDGGGLYASVNMSSTFTLADNNVENNDAIDSTGGGGYGGGVRADLETFVVFAVTGNTILANAADYVGGLRFDADYLCNGVFDDNEVADNDAHGFSSESCGGGYVEIDRQSTSTFHRNEFRDNENDGGDCGGLHLLVDDNSRLTGSDLVLEDNEADEDYGGGVVRVEDYSRADLDGVDVTGNWAGDDFGGVFFAQGYEGGNWAGDHSQLYLQELYVYDNEAIDEYGGVGFESEHNSQIVATGTQVISNTADQEGGGGYVNVDDGSKVDLSHSQFIRNASEDEDGGGLYVEDISDGSTLVLSSTHFLTNTADEEGGGIYFVNGPNQGSHVDLSYARFISNTAEFGDGGGFYMGNQSYNHDDDGVPALKADHTVFLRNWADEYGGGAYLGSAYEGAQVVFDDSEWRDNYAGEYGGALYSDDCYDRCTFSVQRSIFVGNEAYDYDGGAVYFYEAEYDSEAYFDDNEFTDNKAGEDGGAFCSDYFAEYGAHLYFRDNVITGNVISSASPYDGGGLYVYEVDEGATAWMTGNQINDNKATGLGGGVYWEDGVDYGATLYFEDNDVLRNWAGDEGGGFYFDSEYEEGSYLYFRRNQVNDNVALSHNGGAYFYHIEDGTLAEFAGNEFNRNTAGEDYGGFDIEQVDTGSLVRIWDNDVIGNRAGISGTLVTGGDYGGLSIEDIMAGSEVHMRGNRILSNTAYLTGTTGGDYGGMYAALSDGATLNMLNNTIAGNIAQADEGGLHVGMADESRLIMEHNTIQANMAVTDSGGFYLEGADDSQYFLRRNKILDNVAGSRGGLWINNEDTDDPLWGFTENNLIAGNVGSGIYLENANLHSTNDTIADNGAYGVMISTTQDISATAWLTNAIVWGNTNSFVVGDLANCAIHANYSDVQGGSPGINNKNEDPQFVNPAANNYHLKETSPAVGAANTALAPLIDLDGIPRPVPAGGEADMGCYEWFRAGVTLAPDGAGSGKPGTVVTYDLTVTNDGNLPDTFTLGAPINPLGWPVAFVPPTVTLDPGASTTVQARVTVPAGTDAGTLNQVTAQATSQIDPAVQDIALLATTAELAPALTLEPDRQAAASGGAVVYEHTLTNLSNGPETFLLSASSSQGWTVSFSALAPTLAKGEARTIKVWISVPRTVPPGTVDVTTVTATSASDATVSDSVVDTTTREALPFNVLLPIILRNH